MKFLLAFKYLPPPRAAWYIRVLDTGTAPGGKFWSLFNKYDNNVKDKFCSCRSVPAEKVECKKIKLTKSPCQSYLGWNFLLDEVEAHAEYCEAKEEVAAGQHQLGRRLPLWDGTRDVVHVGVTRHKVPEPDGKKTGEAEIHSVQSGPALHITAIGEKMYF